MTNTFTTMFWTLTIVASLVCINLVPTDGYTIKRSPAQMCSNSTPCGWEVYKPYERTVDYFIKSPCECPVESRCVRSTDDLSISAYVHRCRKVQDITDDEWRFGQLNSNSDETDN